MDQKFRRYDLDWLRIIVFGLLIFYHVGMFFVPWGWHIKNNEISDVMRWPMLFLNQWRLPILFVISGMGTYYALSKRGLQEFILERYLRLGIPLVVGMVLIVPPQVYFERLSNQEFTGSLWDYLTGPAYTGIYPEGNISWHHLWFLPYLLAFSIVLSPVFIQIKKRSTGFIRWIQKQIQSTLGLYLFIIPLYIIEVAIEPFFPVTHALIDDWFNFINSMCFFMIGFIVIAVGKEFWQHIAQIKSKALIIGSIAFSIQLFIWIQGSDSLLIHCTEALVKVTNLWSWILVIFGYASQFLNKRSSILSYCNRAVYPFYILHQTITVMIGYYVMNLEWSIALKFILMVIGTFLISWMIYHFIILKIPFLQPLFGLKKAYAQEEKSS